MLLAAAPSRTEHLSGERLPWNPDARRGANDIPATAPVEVASAELQFSPGWNDPAYRFGGGVAQALHGVEVFVEDGSARPGVQLLGELRTALDEVPPLLLEHVSQIRVLARSDDGYDRFYEKAYGIPGFHAVAAGGGGAISFFGGRPYTQSTLFHELGHELSVGSREWRRAVADDDATIAALARSGRLAPDEFEPVPDPVRRARWTPRLAAGAVTPYGASATGEDISESLSQLLSERHFGHAFAHVELADGSRRELTFAEAYPARTAVLERASRSDLDGDGAIGATSVQHREEAAALRSVDRAIGYRRSHEHHRS